MSTSNTAPFGAVRQNHAKPLMTRRGVDLSAAEKAETATEKLAAYKVTLAGIPWSHNEARRVGQMAIDQLIDVVVEQQARIEVMHAQIVELMNTTIVPAAKPAKGKKEAVSE